MLSTSESCWQHLEFIFCISDTYFRYCITIYFAALSQYIIWEAFAQASHSFFPSQLLISPTEQLSTPEFFKCCFCLLAQIGTCFMLASAYLSVSWRLSYSCESLLLLFWHNRTQECPSLLYFTNFSASPTAFMHDGSQFCCFFDSIIYAQACLYIEKSGLQQTDKQWCEFLPWSCSKK